LNIFFGVTSISRHNEVAERAEICSTYKDWIGRIRETDNYAVFVPVWFVQNYRNIINDHNSICHLNDDDYIFIFITTYVQKR
jgi:hypothetical protein